ncbi:MAG: ABC transporter permease, partial [Acidiferrobacteraceae bacterium]|nr:ABC transporter permease [Acidiferrobacteraceae bacterium]
MSNPDTPHYVSDEPFDPQSVERLTAAQEQLYLASQWRLMWWKLKRHKLALICGAILAIFYIVAAFAEWWAPYDLHTRNARFIHAPPQAVHLFHEGKFVGPFVYGYHYKLNMSTLKREFNVNKES